MLTLVELFGAVFLFIWCGKGDPTCLFKHYTSGHQTIKVSGKMLDEDTHRWTEGYNLFLSKASSILTK